MMNTINLPDYSGYVCGAKELAQSLGNISKVDKEEVRILKNEFIQASNMKSGNPPAINEILVELIK